MRLRLTLAGLNDGLLTAKGALNSPFASPLPQLQAGLQKRAVNLTYPSA
jgi:hypothetical protein